MSIRREHEVPSNGSPSGEEGRQKRRLTRRKLLTKVLPTVAVGSAVGYLGNEVAKEINGLVTNHAIYMPFYRRHDSDLTAESVPHTLDIYFNELSIPDLSTSLPVVLLYGTTDLGPRSVSESLLAKFAKEKTEVMFGDINISTENDFLIVNSIETTIGLTGLASLLLQKMNDAYSSPSRRRSILKGVAASAALVGLAPASYPLLGLLSSEISHDAPFVGRIVSRLEGVTSNLHPENKVRNRIAAIESFVFM